MTSDTSDRPKKKRARHHRSDFEQLLGANHPTKNFKLIQRLVHTIERMADEVVDYWNRYSEEVQAGDPPYTRMEVIDEFYDPLIAEVYEE